MTEAAIAEVSVTDHYDGGDSNEERSLASDAWRAMRRNPLFWVAAALITVFVAHGDLAQPVHQHRPAPTAILAKSRERPNADAWFGRDIQGYDIYARCIYGARASILVGVLCTARHRAHRRRHRRDLRLPGRLGRLADVAHR